MGMKTIPEKAIEILDQLSHACQKEIPAYEHRQRQEKGHAEDVVNWIKKLSNNPSPELLAAGWLHDCERLMDFDGDVGFKGDRNSPEYLAHKKNHAKRSAALARQNLEAFGVASESVDRTCELIIHHDDTWEEIERRNDQELMILVSADSFSFFSFIAPDMLRREGEERLQKKAHFMVEKMGSTMRSLLSEQKFDDSTIERVKQQALLTFQTK